MILISCRSATTRMKQSLLDWYAQSPLMLTKNQFPEAMEGKHIEVNQTCYTSTLEWEWFNNDVFALGKNWGIFWHVLFGEAEQSDSKFLRQPKKPQEFRHIFCYLWFHLNDKHLQDFAASVDTFMLLKVKQKAHGETEIRSLLEGFHYTPKNGLVQ